MNARRLKLHRSIAVLLLVLTAFSAFSLGVFAAGKTPDEIREENRALSIKRANEILEIKINNSNAGVNTLLTQYELKLYSIPKAELELEETTELIELYYQQALSVNDVAKIYYEHFTNYPSNTAEAGQLEDILATIDSSDDADALAALTEATYDDGGLRAKMHVAIYTEKLNALYNTDSEIGSGSQVDGKIQAAIEAIKADGVSSGVESTDYKEIFEGAQAAVAVQRNQDIAIDQITSVFNTLYPSGDAAATEIKDKWVAEVEKDQTTEISDMNGYVKDAVAELVGGLMAGERENVKDYYENIKSTVDTAVKNTENNSVVDLTDIFADHDSSLFEAEVEDEKQTLKDKYDKTLSDIDGMGYLTDSKKDELKDEALNAYNEALGDISGAATGDRDTVKDAQDTADSRFSDVTEQGNTANNTARQEQISDAKKELDEKYQEVIDGINGSQYISDEKKQELKDKAADTLDEAKKELDSSKNSADIDSARSDTLTELESQIKANSKLDATEKQTQSTRAEAELENKRNELDKLLDGMEYLDDLQKQEIKNKIDSVIDEAKADLSFVESSADIQNARDDALAAMDAIAKEAEQTNLSEAKQSATQEINKIHQQKADEIDDFKYLTDEQKAEKKAELDDALKVIEERISAAANAAEVERLLAGAINDFTDRGLAARALDDGECISMLKPYMIGFGIVGIVEAIILILLLQKRTSIALAAFVPTRYMAVALTFKPSAAWTFTVIEALADAIMAVFIVYLCVQIWKEKRYVEEAVFDTPSALDDEFFRCEEHDFGDDDGDAALCIPTVVYTEEPVICEQRERRIRERTLMAHVNIDTIDKLFEANATVDISALKQKGAVPKKARCIKVLGRGEITKPITVSARRFSVSAERKITNAGGTADRR